VKLTTSKSRSFASSYILGSIIVLIACLGSTELRANIEYQRVLFHDASLALHQNQFTKFNRLMRQLDDYPAKPYLEYDAFKRRVSRAKVTQVEQFLDRHAGIPFEYHARGKWLSVLARRGDWTNYLKFFDGRENTRLQCLAFKARLKLDQLEGLNEDIIKIWSRGYSQPSECDPAFAYFLNTYTDAEQAIWLRVEKAFKVRRPHLARYLGKKLDQESRAIIETWYQAHRRPEKSLKQLIKAEDTMRNRTIIVHAIDRLARKDSLKALDYWQRIEHKFAFEQAQRDQSQLRIALSSAYQHKPEARELLSALDASIMNDQARLWLARIQLRGQDWNGLQQSIDKMPAHLLQENEWQYWLSRSLESQGQIADSVILLEQLANKSSYYGFLAADKLNLGYQIEQEDASHTAVDEETFLAANPHMLRARELFYLDRLVDAKREWFQALRKLNHDQIKQAATLASKWKWHDSAIRTVAKTPHRSDFSLRFPMPYKQQVLENAQARQLDPSLIYGVMRRESLFDPFARSSVGALGLMQLMPRTARTVASSLGLKRPGKADILQIGTNIRLGSHYLKRVMNRFEDNVALAAAAYNAGPGNVKRWLPKESTMPADLWVETVPFTETRNYVQAVLAYSTVFDKSRGKDTLMSSRMGDIKTEY